MNPPVAARATQASQPSLRDRLKDPSLLREHCYIDGASASPAGQKPDPRLDGREEPERGSDDLVASPGPPHAQITGDKRFESVLCCCPAAKGIESL